MSTYNRVVAADSSASLAPTVRARLATEMADPTSEVGTALASTFAPRPSWATSNGAYDVTLDAYNLHPGNLSHWRAARARAGSGVGTGHVTAFLDSVMYGAAASGVTQPKPTHAIYGRLKLMLDAEFGDAGSGIVIPWDTWFATPADDPRLVVTGTASTVALGAHQLGAIRWLNGAGVNYVEFTDTCTEFVVYTLASGSRPRVTIDGGAEYTIAGNPDLDPSLTDYDPEPGFWGEGASSGQIVTHIPAGTLGSHTLRILAPTNGTSYVTLAGVEGRTGDPGIRVSGMARSGIASVDLVTDDITNGLLGMAVSLDMAQADLAVMLLAMNDFQGHVSVATFKDRITTAVQRQKSTSGYGAGGDVLLVTAAQPDYAYPIPADGTYVPAMSEYYTALYEVADSEDVPLLDIASRWVDFGTSDALGFFGDSLHPGDAGSEDIARAIHNALMAV